MQLLHLLFDLGIKRLVLCSDSDLTSTKLRSLSLYLELTAESKKVRLAAKVCLQLTSVLDWSRRAAILSCKGSDTA